MKNGIHIKVFEFPQNIPPSKHTLRVFDKKFKMKKFILKIMYSTN